MYYIKSLLREWFPLNKAELRKFLLLGGVYFLICMNYTVLRNLKDTLVITYPDLGVEVIPFLRTWLLAPVMFVFTWSYIRLSRHFSVYQLFFYFLTFFSLFFLFFIFYLYPHREQLVLSASFPSLIRHWSFSLFYIFAEVWGTVMILLLFWGYVNQHTPLEQAKRFYAPFLFCANLSGIAASKISLWLSRGQLKIFLFPQQDHWGSSLCVTVLWVLISCSFAAFFFAKLEKNALSSKREKKENFSLSHSIAYLFRERKLWPFAIMIFSYFFSTGILELLWKNELQIRYPNPNDFNDILNIATFWISLLSTLIALTVSGALVRQLPLPLVAALTPLLLLIPLILWFFFSLTPLASFSALSTLMGSFYFCLNRITKFTFFDLSKELACVPLTVSEQTQAKAVLDGILPKLGKLTESLYLQTIFLLFGTFQASHLFILFCLILLHVGWLSSTYFPYLQRGLDEKAH